MSIFGNDFKADKSGKFGQYFIIGRVKSIVQGPFTRSLKVFLKADGLPTVKDVLEPNADFTSFKDIGKIRFEIMYSNLSGSKLKEVTEPAFPIFSFIKQYPLVGEIVLIMSGPSPNLNDNFNAKQLFYFPPYALWNGVNHNAFPDMEEYAQYVGKASSKPEFQGKTNTLAFRLPLGKTFIENERIKNLRPFEGDIIIESRFGQSIRFGSTVKGLTALNYWSETGITGDPITIIRNGQGKPADSDPFASTVEDINSDDSSIYLTSGQKIVLEDLATFPFSSYSKGISDQTQTILEIEQVPTSNDILSPQQQDTNSIAQ